MYCIRVYNLNETPNFRTLAHFGALFTFDNYTQKSFFLLISYLRRIDVKVKIDIVPRFPVDHI